MTDRELMQQALDALEYASDQTKPENLHGCDCLVCKTILALRDKLAQSERQWVGLTNEEIETFVAHLYPLPEKPVKERLRALEAKLKEKNTKSYAERNG